MKDARFIKIALIVSSYLFFSTLSYAEESITITTYYPSPYGSYSVLRTENLQAGVDGANYDYLRFIKANITGNVFEAVNYVGGFMWNENTGTGFGDGDDFTIYANGGRDMYLTTAGGSANMMLKASGNVGIGTMSPGHKLDVQGSGITRIRVGSSNNQAGISFVSDNSAENVLYSPSGTDDLRFYLGSTDRVSITNAGNVGVGTVGPRERLDVAGAIRIPGASGTDNDSPGLTLASDDDFLYDSEYLNHYGFGFHQYNDSNVLGGNAYISGFFGVDLFTNGTNRLRINRNGNVGIGTTTPQNKLDVEGGMAVGATYSGANAAPANGMIVEGNVGIGKTNPAYKLDVETDQAQIFAIRGYHSIGPDATTPDKTAVGGSTGIPTNYASGGLGRSWRGGDGTIWKMGVSGYAPAAMHPTAANTPINYAGYFKGRVGIFDTASVCPAGNGDGTLLIGLPPSTKNDYGLQVSGGCSPNGGKAASWGWESFSSRRWKKNIRPIDGALNKVMRLNGVYFDWKKSGERAIGMIAEDVGKIIPEVVSYEKNGVDAVGLDYARLTSVLVEAIKEQQKEIASLREEIESLKQKK